MKNLFKPFALAIVFVLIMVGLSQCKKLNIATLTTGDTNLVGYLEKYPETYSEFIKVLEKSGTASFMNAYGTYTLFAPTNDAMKNYLQEIGKSSIDDISADDLKTMVRYHVLGDTISTPAFTDGKLPVPTMHGEYLITSVNNENGVSRYIVNRRAIILQANIHTGNGVLHSIDHVLIPSSKTLYQKLKENSNYSLFVEALDATGVGAAIQKLTYKNDTTPNWYTVLAQSNAVFAARNIFSLDDLKATYTKPGANIQDPKDSLNMYMAYHILTGLKFTADLVMSPSHETLVPQEVVTTVLKEENVLLNYETTNGVTDSSLVNRPYSDIACINGVLHDLNNNLYIKIRYPTAVYWDVAEQPEIMKLTSIFRKGGKSITFQMGDLKDITWPAGTVDYLCNNPGAKDLFYWNDRLSFNYVKTTAGQMNWFELTTPLIIKGRYKVWVCWRSNAGTTGLGMQTWIDGVLMPRLFSFGDYNYGKTLSEDQVRAQGWKRYYVGASTADHMASKLVGTVDILTTGRHKIRFVTTEVSPKTSGSWLDMIHFIPEAQDQYSPKFATDGSLVY
jgi:uncharacterized surface protein with fasciclin (FAS1) repeats